MTYHEIDNGIGSSLHPVILWQYENAPVLRSFVESMCEAAYLCVDDFWDKWAVFNANVDMADSFGLSVIGMTCGVPRPFEYISNALYAKLIKCRMKLTMTTACTTADYAAYIEELFSGNVSVTDNMDMSVSFSSPLPDESWSELKQLYLTDINSAYGEYWKVLPTGVKHNISQWEGNVFSFNGSQTFRLGAFSGDEIKSAFITEYEYEYRKGLTQ